MENLQLVQEAPFSANARKFLRFETLTLAPFDRALVEPELLPTAALRWLNEYHARVRDMLSPMLTHGDDGEALAWLQAATAPI
jgi:Xaa-Pro aminopeptidase